MAWRDNVGLVITIILQIVVIISGRNIDAMAMRDFLECSSMSSRAFASNFVMCFSPVGLVGFANLLRLRCGRGVAGLMIFAIAHWRGVIMLVWFSQ